jgi:hypothetical protein
MPKDLDTSLKIIAYATNNHPRGQTPKLDSVGSDPDERFFMLATFCFDLSRKLKYISHALAEYYPPSNTRKPLDPEYTQIIQDDECKINPKPNEISWKEMAYRAEEVMIRLHKELLAEGYPKHPPEGGCPPEP